MNILSWLFCGSSNWDSLGASWVLISDQKRLWCMPSSPYSSPAPELGPLCRNASLGKRHQDLSLPLEILQLCLGRRSSVQAEEAKVCQNSSLDNTGQNMEKAHLLWKIMSAKFSSQGFQGNHFLTKSHGLLKISNKTIITVTQIISHKAEKAHTVQSLPGHTTRVTLHAQSPQK